MRLRTKQNVETLPDVEPKVKTPPGNALANLDKLIQRLEMELAKYKASREAVERGKKP